MPIPCDTNSCNFCFDPDHARPNFKNRVSGPPSGHLFRPPCYPGSPRKRYPGIPDSLNNWLARLKLLYGVPFNYLVPDEGMVPPESIRFFYLNLNWIDALLDGAFSIGRDLSADEKSAELNLDRALLPQIRPGVHAAAGLLRAKGLGQAGADPSMQVVSGFLLRSRLVTEYPNLGVYAYEKGHTPKDSLTPLS